MSFLINRLYGRKNVGGTVSRITYPEISPHDEQPESRDERRADIIKWWTYYHGSNPATGKSQWTYLYERFETMPRREIEDVENHTRICTDRLRRLLVNSWRGFEFDDERTGARIADILNRNRWPHLLNLAALYGKVTGDVFIKLAPAQPGSQFGPVRLILLDSEAVEIDVSPHDRNDVRSVTVSYDFFEPDKESTGKYSRHSYREILDTSSVTAFVDDEYAPGYSYDHNLGFIPVVHVRNLDPGGGVYGESFVGRLTDAQDTMNLLATDILDIVRYDGHKTTIFQNVNIDKAASRDGATSGEIDLSIGKGLVVKGEGRVYKLDNQHDLGAALQEYDRKLDAFYDLAGVPRFSRDMVSHLGNLSGKAIERLYQDAIESTREAQGLYGESFRELAVKIAVMLGIEPPGVQVLWNTDVVSADIEILAREYETGARSIRSVMRKLGITDVDRMRQEIEEEKG
ncbi:phage portal protein [bacterium]|nr:phage portal protein [bacterium]